MPAVVVKILCKVFIAKTQAEIGIVYIYIGNSLQIDAYVKPFVHPIRIKAETIFRVWITKNNPVKPVDHVIFILIYISEISRLCIWLCRSGDLSLGLENSINHQTKEMSYWLPHNSAC